MSRQLCEPPGRREGDTRENIRNCRSRPCPAGYRYMVLLREVVPCTGTQQGKADCGNYVCFHAYLLRACLAARTVAGTSLRIDGLDVGAPRRRAGMTDSLWRPRPAPLTKRSTINSW